MLAKEGHGLPAALAGACTAVISVVKAGVEVFIGVADAEPTTASANRPKSIIRGSWNFMSEDNL
jgi:hypothetical protein